MTERMDERGDSEQPDDEQRAEAGGGRRAFLRGVLGLGLANVTVSFFGAVPAMAHPQDADADCGVPEGGGTVTSDDDCDIGANAPDLDCGKNSAAGGVHRDESCTTPTGKGFSRDNDCGKPKAPEGLHADLDCGVPAGPDPSVKQRDDLCGKPNGSGAQGPYTQDHACAQPPNKFQNNNDMACSKPAGGGNTFADGSCGKPAVAGGGGWADMDCGRVTGNTTHTDSNCNQPGPGAWVIQDDNCGVVSPSGFSTDAECSKPDAWGGAHKDNDCLLGNFSDSNQDDKGG